MHKKEEAGFTLTELLLIVVIVSISVILATPFIHKVRTKATLLVCEENLQKISLGLKLYASEHEGRFPLDLDELIEDGYVEDERVFDCPSTPHIGDVWECDYDYKAGCTILSPSSTEIISDKPKNHEDGRNVLYVSGNIGWKSTKYVR